MGPETGMILNCSSQKGCYAIGVRSEQARSWCFVVLARKAGATALAPCIRAAHNAVKVEKRIRGEEARITICTSMRDTQAWS